MTLHGKRVVVLGGSSGIGLATAQAAVREGATVVIASSRKARIDEALATLRPVQRAMRSILRTGTQRRRCSHGSAVSIIWSSRPLIHCSSAALATSDVDAAHRFFTLRYWGAYCAAKYGSSSIRRGGSIVFTSGIAGSDRRRAGHSVPVSVRLWKA